MSTAPEKFLPSLPGFKAKEHKENFRHKTCLKYVDNGVKWSGMIVVKPDSRDLPYIDPSASFDASASLQDTLFITPSKNSVYYHILTFFATYGEWNNTTRETETKSCMIQYFMDDKTIKITETGQLANGVSKEVILQKTLLLKDDGTPYEIEDFSMSNYNDINNKTYNIIDADDITRKFLDKWYEKKFRSSSPSESNEWGKWHNKKNFDNLYNEATLGNTVNNIKREGFVSYGDKTLKFVCLCENKVMFEKSPAASIAPQPFQLFTLVYHLCDDSMEIFAIPDPKITEPFSRLLARSYLPKKPVSTSSIVGLKDENYFHWKDFGIGVELTVFSRVLKLIDCDATTREFYNNKGLPLAPSIAAPKIPKIEYKREIPPPTAFGSEEDSLRSCVGSLRPSAPRAKIFDEEINLKFQASLVSDCPEDAKRRFVFVYFVTDKTLQILEPPIKNSGFVGGVFLSRREIKSAVNGNKIVPKDFIIGNNIQILRHVFKIEKADGKTIEWMENKKIPQSDINIILKKILPFLIVSVDNGELKQEFDQLTKFSSYLGKSDLGKIFSKYIPSSYWKPDESIYDSIDTVLNEHEVITIARAFTPQDDPSAFDYMDLFED